MRFKRRNVMRINRAGIDFKSTKNEFTAKKFVRISIQFTKDCTGAVSTGCRTIDFSEFENGKYIITATANDSEYISVKYTFI